MSGTLSIDSGRACTSLGNTGNDPENDGFSVGKSIAHIARKANYKQLDNGQFIKRGKCNWIRRNVEGNTADDRYHRAAYESSQRNTCAMLAETYRAEQGGVRKADVDLADNDLLKSRVTRQDNLRFNPQLTDRRSYGLSRRNALAVRFSRIAHFCNGLTEWGAAPTGMLLKSSRIALTPNRDDRSALAQVRIMGALGLIAAAVSGFSYGVLGKSLGKTVSQVPKALYEDAKNLVASYSMVAAVSSIFSLIFSGASELCVSRERLSSVMMNVLTNNQARHINRLHTLLSQVKDVPDAVVLLRKALEPKIDKSCMQDGEPVLLKRLLADLESANGSESMVKAAMRKTLGAYQVEKDITGTNTGDMLNARTDRAELLKRENHVVALTNLIEHHRIDGDESSDYKDLRHRVEDLVKKTRQGVLTASASLLGVLGFAGMSAKLEYLNSAEFLKARETMKSSADKSHAMRFSGDYMLDNRHQYGPLTRGLLNASEVVRTFNHGVLLSLNYQLTRPIAWLAGRFTEHVLHKPNSRTVSFSIGRAVASSIWAVVDAVFILSPAAARGIGFSGNTAGGGPTLPLKIPLGGKVLLPIAATSTGAQMLLTSVVSFLFLMAAKGTARLEGWDGNTGRGLLGPDHRLEPLNLKHLAKAK